MFLAAEKSGVNNCTAVEQISGKVCRTVKTLWLLNLGISFLSKCLRSILSAVHADTLVHVGYVYIHNDLNRR